MRFPEGVLLKRGIAAAALLTLLVPAITSALAPSPSQPIPAPMFIAIAQGGYVAPPPAPLPHFAYVTVAPRRADVRPSLVRKHRDRPAPPRLVKLLLRSPGDHVLIGVATWYCLAGVSRCMAIHPSGLYAAAGPRLRAALGLNWRGRAVTVWNGSLHVTVTLADWCACGSGHVIDLYSDAMRVIDPGFRTNGGVSRAIIRW